MKIKISYSEEEFNETVKFILKNNYFIEDATEEKIKLSLISSMKELASHKDRSNIAIMGYIIVVEESEEESLDSDENTVYLKIYVDPALKYTTSGFPDNDRIEFTIDVLSSEYWKDSNE